jgi:hypothetical protein
VKRAGDEHEPPAEGDAGEPFEATFDAERGVDAPPEDAPRLELAGDVPSSEPEPERAGDAGEPTGDASAASATSERPPAPPPSAPKRGFFAWLGAFARDKVEATRAHFVDHDPTFWGTLGPFAALAMVLYTRAPGTNFIFDEQEALLANPYVNATQKLGFWDAVNRDFWGLPPNASVGSYRPLPNFFWRALWQLSKQPNGFSRQPFLHHFYNVLLHSVNAALLTLFVFAVTKRKGVAYLAGATFVSSAILTEAVSGIVGVADVFCGLGCMAALLALRMRAWAMPVAVGLSLSFSLFSKESGIVLVPLVPLAALLFSPVLHPDRPARWQRTFLAAVAALTAFVVYVELRKRWFPAPLPQELTRLCPDEPDNPQLHSLFADPEGFVRCQPPMSSMKRAFREFLLWFHQAPLPKDPLNNPLAEVDMADRVAGALRVYARGLGQVLFPASLSPDYSYPQEPVPDRLYTWEIQLGGALLVGPPLFAMVAWVAALVRERALGLTRGARVPWRGPEGALARTLGRVVAFGLLATLLVLASRTPHAKLDDFFFLEGGRLVPDPSAPGEWLYEPHHYFARVGLLVTCATLLVTSLGLSLDAGRPSPPPAWEAYPRSITTPLLVAFALVFVVVSYFPQSNIPVVLPTVRAERFWYLPVVGTSLLVALVMGWAAEATHHAALRLRELPRNALVAVVFSPMAFFFLFQWVQAYRHAMSYRSDVDFWDAAKDAVPNSSKAHLNFSVMKGARQDYETRLKHSLRAMELAPKWTMATIYTGDTLCRMGRPHDAWPYYQKGFDLGPNETSLIALALQCMWDTETFKPREKELRELATKHNDAWLRELIHDTLANGDKNRGVAPKYRPRGYNEGPKE